MATSTPSDFDDLSTLASKASTIDKTLSGERTKLYPEQMWYTLACFIAVVSVFQFASFLHTKLSSKQPMLASRSNSEKTSASSRHGVSLRRIPLSIVNVYRVLAFRFTINFFGSYSLNVAEFIVTLMYIAALFGWEFINTTDREGRKDDVSYWGNRAGAIATSQFPLITALGTKNNLLALITGISYDKLNYIHRMTARVVFVLVWVHVAGGVKLGISRDDLQSNWLRAGIMVGVAWSLLVIVSIRPIRAGAYKVFFYAHIVTVFIILIGSYFHALKYNPYLIASFIIWGLDRFIRCARLIVYNHSYFWFSAARRQAFDASTELLSNHLVRLRVRRPPHFRWKAGQTAYLIVPAVSRIPFEAHPFTIASFDPSSVAPATSLTAHPPGHAPRAARGSTDMPLLWSESADESAARWKELVFLVNIRKGFTKRLGEAAAKNSTVKVYIDGPYGPAPDLKPFDTSVLIAGGSGISYTMPVLFEIMEQVRIGASRCRRVLFIWIIREASHVDWVSDSLRQVTRIIPSQLDLSICIYCTGSLARSARSLQARTGDWQDAESVHSNSESDSAPSQGPRNTPSEKAEVKQDKEKRGANAVSVVSLSAVSWEAGRPDLARILKEEVQSQVADARMSVSVCGSQTIARTVRAALAFPLTVPGSVLRGAPSVSLFVESFGLV